MKPSFYTIFAIDYTIDGNPDRQITKGETLLINNRL